MGEMDDELLVLFLTESKEHLSDIETDLLSIEAAGADIDEELVNKVFRAAHSIKGGAGFFHLSKIQDLSHKTENVLEMVRSRKMVPTPDVVNILLLSFDKLRDMINNHEQSNDADIDEIVTALSNLAENNLPAEKKPTVSKMVDITLPNGRSVISVSQFDLDSATSDGKLTYLLDYDMIDDIQRNNRTPLDVLRVLQDNGLMLSCMLDMEAVGTLEDEGASQIPFFVLYATPIPLEGLIDLLGISKDKIIRFNHDTKDFMPPPAAAFQPEQAVKDQPAPIPTAPAVEDHLEETKHPAQTASSAKEPSGSVTAQSDANLRVSVTLLESLMNLAGELVLSRNQLVEAITRNDSRLIHATGQRINLVTSELQETIMLTRMQPVGNVLNKFPRVIRDMSRELQKDIQLQLSGRDVEMDKTIIEGLSDPLTHLVRNAVDHGIEKPEERKRQGKNPSGTVSINVYHEAGQVVIEIIDDGKGIDSENVAQAAMTKGMVTQDQLKTMSDSEKMFLIFQPGLSTAEKVTDVSGRGVGMDVVKTNLDRLGGKIEIDSEIGKGTTFRIKLPLTLAIIPSLLVSVAGERFAIPQVNVREMISVTAEQVKEKIEIVGDAEVLVLRGELIPIIELANVLGVERTFVSDKDERQPDRRKNLADRRSSRHTEDSDELHEAASAGDDGKCHDNRTNSGRRYHADSGLNIVIVTAGALQYGLVVDELHDTVEIVVKPLGRHLKGSREYAGATILGDGRVALILDIGGISEKAGLISVANSSRAHELADEVKREESTDTHAFLLFNNGPEEHCAVPLGLVARIEHVDLGQIENLGGKRTMQYRGGSLPLVTLKDAVQVEQMGNDQDLVVIVFEVAGREIGLLASIPVDVIETRVEIDETTLKQVGVVGSTIINNRTTLIVDIFELVQAAHPEWIGSRRRGVFIAGNAPTVLLAEDSAFFRNQVKTFFESEGYEVIDAEDGQAAWEALEKSGDRVKLVVTDIEMPRLDGLGLTKNIRADARFSHLPIMALTSLAAEEDVTKGKAVGVDDYQIKLDKERVLASARKMLDSDRVAA